MDWEQRMSTTSFTSLVRRLIKWHSADINSLGGDTDILELEQTSSSSLSWKDVGQLTEKAGTKLEISTIDCDFVHSYIEENPPCHPGPLKDMQIIKSRIVKNVSVFLIASGEDSKGYARSSEEYDLATNQTIPVGDTKKDRRAATFCNNFLCGGSPSDKSCEKFDGKNFESLPVTLLEKRYFHMCWGLKSGEVILLGGHNSPTTSEVVSADGTSSSPSFNLTTETS